MSTEKSTLEIRRNGALATLVGATAAAVAVLYLARALGGGSTLDWLLFAGLGLLGAAHLSAALDARTPLLVADDHGVRVRLGRSWRGVPWNEVDHVEHRPRHAPWRDGRLTVTVDDEATVLHGLDRGGRRQVAIARRLYGAPLSLPLALTTRVVGADGDLTLALERLLGDPARVVEVVPFVEEHEDEHEVEHEDEVEPEVEVDGDAVASPHPVLPDPRPAMARGIGYVAELLRPRRTSEREPDESPAPGPVEPVAPAALVASPTPLPLRDPVGGARVEARFEGAAALRLDPAELDDQSAVRLPEADVLRRDPDETQLFDRLVVGEAFDEGDAGLDDEPEAAPEPVIGPQLAAARARLGLSVDQLAERTRIRPHVIESIEVDDFAPCGGDFYARGHLRTLSRVLGVDVAPLLATYDQEYADAPIDARRVFEAELAVGADGPIRSTRGGPNWSVLVAAVMTLVLAWSIARLLTDSPVHLQARPVLNGSPSGQKALAAPVPVLLDAAKGGAHVVVRDGAGKVVFRGDLAYGERKTLKAGPPVQVQSSDGALKVTVDGQARGPLGASGQPAQDTFAASP